MDVLVSERGQIVDASASPPMRDLRSADARHDTAERLGFVRFVRRADGTVHLKLRSGTISNACFMQLVWLLTDLENVRIFIQDEASAGVAELVQNFHEAVARLDAIRAATPGEPPRHEFLAVPLSLDRLRHPKRRVLAKAYRQWRAAQGVIGPEHDPTEKRGTCNGDFLLLRIGRDLAATIEAWPSYITVYTPCVRLSMIGSDVTRQPDAAFGERVSPQYHAVSRTEAPLLELIEAVIRPPGQPARRSRYERLLLPWRTASGADRYVCSNAIIRSRCAIAEAAPPS